MSDKNNGYSLAVKIACIVLAGLTVLGIAVGIIAYLVGSISSSVIVSKKMAGFDVREKGSGNAGSTNMLRSVGKKAAVITLICDILKGVVAIGIAVMKGLSQMEEEINA